jgi:hypothetical protein
LVYLVEMRSRILFALPFLALSLLGNSCNVRVGSNLPPPPPPPDSGEGEPDQNGLTILIRAGDQIDPPGEPTPSTTTGQGLLAVSLSMSTLSSPLLHPRALGESGGNPATGERGVGGSEPGFGMNVLAAGARSDNPPTGAVPEPGAAILFGAGLVVASLARRPRPRVSLNDRGAYGLTIR